MQSENMDKTTKKNPAKEAAEGIAKSAGNNATLDIIRKESTDIFLKP